jgi:hypothetical protein
MKQAFDSPLVTSLNRKNKAKLAHIIEIVEDYQKMGYTLTLRQVYYQMVSRGFIGNNMKEYDSIGRIVKIGRLKGEIDWDAIEDRTRWPRLPYWAHDIDDAIDDAHAKYRRLRSQGQEHYIEMWVEKDAISNILYRYTSEYMVKLMVNRGYSSTTAMYDAYKRFLAATFRGQKPVILYLGDHDPSGLDMLRDIQERMEVFGVDVELKHVGITMEQIAELNPPPFPAKMSDSRASWYVSEFGYESWEVDALPPEKLKEIVVRSIEGLFNMKLYNEILEQEREEKGVLKLLPEMRLQIPKLKTMIDNVHEIIEAYQAEMEEDEEKGEGEKAAELGVLREIKNILDSEA